MFAALTVALANAKPAGIESGVAETRSVVTVPVNPAVAHPTLCAPVFGTSIDSVANPRNVPDVIPVIVLGAPLAPCRAGCTCRPGGPAGPADLRTGRARGAGRPDRAAARAGRTGRTRITLGPAGPTGTGGPVGPVGPGTLSSRTGRARLTDRPGRARLTRLTGHQVLRRTGRACRTDRPGRARCLTGRAWHVARRTGRACRTVAPVGPVGPGTVLAAPVAPTLPRSDVPGVMACIERPTERCQRRSLALSRCSWRLSPDVVGGRGDRSGPSTCTRRIGEANWPP